MTRRLLLLVVFALGSIAVPRAEQCNLLLLGAGTCGATGTPLSTYVLASWDQQEASGNALDATGHAHTGTEQGGAQGTDTGPGGSNASRDYDDNVAEYFQVADHADLSMGDIDFCVETWVILGSNNGFRGLVGKDGLVGNIEWELIYNGGSERFSFVVSSNGTLTTAISGTVKPDTAQWYQLVGCHSATDNELRLYVNSVAVTPVSYSGGVVASGTAPVQLGAIGGTFTLEARQSFSRIYKSYMLTQTVVDWLYNSGSARLFSALQSYVP